MVDDLKRDEEPPAGGAFGVPNTVVLGLGSAAGVELTDEEELVAEDLSVSVVVLNAEVVDAKALKPEAEDA